MWVARGGDPRATVGDDLGSAARVSPPGVLRHRESGSNVISFSDQVATAIREVSDEIIMPKFCSLGPDEVMEEPRRPL